MYCRLSWELSASCASVHTDTVHVKRGNDVFSKGDEDHALSDYQPSDWSARRDLS